MDADFFFSNDDPQLQSSLRIEREFGQAPQVFVAVTSPRTTTREYVRRVHALTEDLRRVDGVADIRSITRGQRDPDDILRDEAKEVFEDLADHPFWRRLLVSPDRSATFVVLRLDGRNNAATVPAIDRVLDSHRKDTFGLGASGVPYVAEHIRTRITDDLRRFSLAAFVMFGLLVGLLFRSVAVLTGMMVAALAA